MARSWKRVAELAENENFECHDISVALLNALERTWRAEVPMAVVDGVRSAFLAKQSDLFPEQRVAPVKELLPEAAGHGFGRLLIDHAIGILHARGSGEIGLADATERALGAYGARAARQIDEHFHRKASHFLTTRVLARVEEALRVADLGTLARKLSGLAPRTAKHPSIKRRGIDDGVPL